MTGKDLDLGHWLTSPRVQRLASRLWLSLAFATPVALAALALAIAAGA